MSRTASENDGSEMALAGSPPPSDNGNNFADNAFGSDSDLVDEPISDDRPISPLIMNTGLSGRPTEEMANLDDIPQEQYKNHLEDLIKSNRCKGRGHIHVFMGHMYLWVLN